MPTPECDTATMPLLFTIVPVGSAITQLEAPDPAGPVGPRAPAAPAAPAGPTGPAGPAGIWPALKSALSSEWFLTFPLVPAVFFNWALPPLFPGKTVAA